MAAMNASNPKNRLLFAAGILGFAALASQMLFMRELVSVFYGNEFSLCALFAAWLLWTAAEAASFRYGFPQRPLLDAAPFRPVPARRSDSAHGPGHTPEPDSSQRRGRRSHYPEMDAADRIGRVRPVLPFVRVRVRGRLPHCTAGRGGKIRVLLARFLKRGRRHLRRGILRSGLCRAFVQPSFVPSASQVQIMALLSGLLIIAGLVLPSGIRIGGVPRRRPSVRKSGDLGFLVPGPGGP